MSERSVLRISVGTLIAACGLLGFWGKALAVDTYSGGLLTMPSLAIGNATLSNVVVKIGSIVSLPSGTAPAGSIDRYDPASGHLTVQAVNYGGHTLYNAVATVASLQSIGALSGADTYAGGTLSVPFVRLLNGPLFAGAVVTKLQIDSRGGGMPLYEQDVYDPGSHVLTIALIEVGGQVYTNAQITVESATVAAYGSVVPDVVGDTETAAATALYAVYLGINNVTQQTSTTVPEGDIISVTPAAGTLVDQGTYVSLVISGGAETLFYSFPAASATVEPYTLISALGGLYGTTVGGGNYNNGQIFSLGYGGVGADLYAFPLTGGAGTYGPNCLILGKDGNFYGTSDSGGTSFQGNLDGGTVFQLTPAGVLTTLYAFGDLTDGVHPNGVIQGSDSNFYGTTANSDVNSSGILFQVTPQKTEKVIHYFSQAGAPPGDGAYPIGQLVEVPQQTATVYYGVTSQGGANGTGIVFAINGSGSETILHSFAAVGSLTDGVYPVGGLMHATNGNFYGMTSNGGANNGGAIYQITPAGQESLIYSFPIVPGGSAGPSPTGALVQATDGNLYGITRFGGSLNYGQVFKLTPSGVFSVVHSFSAGTTDGAEPSSLVQASDGNLYGTTLFGGTNNTGAVFKVQL